MEQKAVRLRRDVVGPESEYFIFVPEPIPLCCYLSMSYADRLAAGTNDLILPHRILPKNS
jgi:hypothetical protein